MSLSNISSICNNYVKYMLMNVVDVASKGVVVPRVYSRSRSKLFASMYRIQSSAEQCSIKPKHLYVIPYVRYYTLHKLLYYRDEEQELDEGDEAVKLTFNEMMTRSYSSKQALENEFFGHINTIKSPKVYSQYVELDRRILNSLLTEDEMISFVAASSEMDDFIAENLSKDIALYTSRKEKLFDFFHDYRYVSGWVTASGIGIFTALFGVKSITALY